MSLVKMELEEFRQQFKTFLTDSQVLFFAFLWEPLTPSWQY